MKIRFRKPDIAVEAGNLGKRRSLGAEIGIFILVFFIGSMIAGIIPAVYDLWVIFTDVDLMEQLEQIILSPSGQGYMSDMMDFLTDMSDGMYIITLFCTFIVILSAIIYCTRLEGRNLYSMGMGKKDAVRNYIVGLLVGLVSFSLCVLIGVLTNTIEIKGLKGNINIGIIVLYFIGFLIQGFSEEITFRGYFMVSLMKKNSVAKAVWINSFAFALCHMLNPGLTLVAFINLMLIGVFLSIYVIKTNDIWGAAAYHSMWNFAQGVLYGISVSGTDVNSAILQTETVSSSSKLLSGGVFGMEGSIFTTIVMSLFMVLLIVWYKKKGSASPVLTEG